MKRYIVDKKAVNILGIETLNASEELSKDKNLTNENLHFSNLPFSSLYLSDEQVEILKSHNIIVTEELKNHCCVFSSNYEKTRSSFYKLNKRALSGKGCNVAIIDSGCITSVVPCDYAVNYADANPFTDVFGHGTKTSSIIKHQTIGLAPNCTFYHLKVIGDDGTIHSESSLLSALDYCITNNIDVVNMSFQYDTTSFRTAVASLVSNGIVVCASCGNNGALSEVSIPAGLPNVIAVNSIAEDGSIHDWNVLPNSTVPVGAHGVDVSCSGWGCETYDKNGNLVSSFGTSFSSPFFAGVFAIYKEDMGIDDNYRILQHIFNKTLKTKNPQYFGAGTPTF